MTDDERAIQTLSKVINDTVAYQLATMPFDRTLVGEIKDQLINGYYNVEIQGVKYKVKSKIKYSIRDKVYLLVPQNNMSNMFILATTSVIDTGGGDIVDSVTSINGKTGIVTLEIIDIPNLENLLNLKIQSSDIVQGDNISISRDENIITISAVDLYYEFEQTEPSSEWTVSHNLNKYPNVTVIDNTGTIIFASIVYLDKNRVKISFSNNNTGKVVFN